MRPACTTAAGCEIEVLSPPAAATAAVVSKLSNIELPGPIAYALARESKVWLSSAHT